MGAEFCPATWRVQGQEAGGRRVVTDWGVWSLGAGESGRSKQE